MGWKLGEPVVHRPKRIEAVFEGIEAACELLSGLNASMSTYLEKKEASERIFVAHAGQAPPETTPVTVGAVHLVLADTLKAGAVPVFVPVEPDPYGLYGYCSDGVLEKVKNDGGGIRFGWVLWEWPNIMLTAEFHAVWVRSDGVLSDITPKPAGEARIAFVPDEAYGADFDFDQRPGNRRANAVPRVDKDALVARQMAAMKPSQKAYESRRAESKAMSLEQWLAAKIDEPLYELVEEFIAASNEVERLMEEAREVEVGGVAASKELVRAIQLKEATFLRVRDWRL